MTSALVLLALACASFAQDGSESPAKPVAAKPDLVASALAKCSKESRFAFFEKIVFVGNRVAGMNYGSILSCLEDGELDKLGERLSHSEVPLKAWREDKRDELLEKLFSDCSASDRKSFYDALSFRNGHLVGMWTVSVKKCGDRDLPRFLSLFGSNGLDVSRWKQDCFCKKPHFCAPRRGYACNLDDC